MSGQKMTSVMKTQIVAAFKMNGLSLRSEASHYLVQVLNPVCEEQREMCLDRIIEAVQKQTLKTCMVDRVSCERAVQECNAEQEEESAFLTVIDAFDVPRLTYSLQRKKFMPNDTLGLPPPSLHPRAGAKATVFRDRYTVLHQRTCRHELFTPPALGNHVDEQKRKFQLRPIEYLLGSTARLGEIIVLGLLTQIKEGKWYLEDSTGAVEVDLSKANFHTGLFTESCFILAEGSYEDEVFHVNAVGFPPPEPAQASRAYFGSINFFGGPGSTCAKSSGSLAQKERDSDEAMLVFLSDVWLDKVKVMSKLKTLFLGYSEYPPTAFIFFGNFLSGEECTVKARHFRESLLNLAAVLEEFPNLMSSSRFIFVPGPEDPGPAHILPRPAVPKVLTEEFCQRIPTAVFTSNPCRLQYCTQEIVLFRDDIVMKMCRNCIKFPSDGDIPEHFTKTLISQGHLCPLPLHVTPVYWSHDYAMQLYPLPDLIVCADKYDPFQSAQVDCTVINPGSFPRNDFSFKVYYPCSRQVEDSRIED